MSKQAGRDHSPFPTDHAPDDVAVLVPAAGCGERMGGRRKQFRKLGGRSVLEQALRAFEHHAQVGHLVVAAPESSVASLEKQVRGLSKLRAVVAGGASRQASVQRALEAAPASARILLVHDAVRPFVAAVQVGAVIEAAREKGAAAPAVPVADTLRRGHDGQFGETVERAGCYQMQTPQAFRRAWLEEAYAAMERDSTAEASASDSVELIRRAGHPVQIVEGDRRNFKITTPSDWQLAQALWPTWIKEVRGSRVETSNVEPKTMRIGYGYDVHRLEGGPPLVLGGVEIDHEKGLAGHSDADVLLHAVADALLGAAALGDLGTHFPDDDEKWRDADSLRLLGAVAEKVAAAGYAPGNIDATLALETPRLRPHIGAMRQNIAEALDLDPDAVSVKATTTEGLGFVGAAAGAAAHAVCLIEPLR